MKTRTKLLIYAALAAALFAPYAVRADDAAHQKAAVHSTAKKKPKKPLKLVRTEQWWSHAGTNSWLVYTKAKRTTIQVSFCDRRKTVEPYPVPRGRSYFWVNVSRDSCLLFDIRQDKKAKFRMTPIG